MTPFLFVYGTLKKGHKNPFAIYLHSHSKFIGTGKIKGRIVLLGKYTALDFIENSSEWVSGEIFEMNSAETVLKSLDDYEGFDPNKPNCNEYFRKICPVLFKKETLNCWVYVYNNAV